MPETEEYLEDNVGHFTVLCVDNKYKEILYFDSLA